MTLLDSNHAKSRYSLSYLFSVCAQAGRTATETRQDEDVHAVDAWVKLAGATVYVQLKCTEAPNRTATGIRVDFEDGWIEKWREEKLPVYIVLVVVPPGQTDWIEHLEDESTLHKAVAYWGRFDPESSKKSITLSLTDRLTLDTMDRWQQDVDDVFGGGAS